MDDFDVRNIFYREVALGIVLVVGKDICNWFFVDQYQYLWIIGRDNVLEDIQGWVCVGGMIDMDIGDGFYDFIEVCGFYIGNFFSCDNGGCGWGIVQELFVVGSNMDEVFVIVNYGQIFFFKGCLSSGVVC